MKKSLISFLLWIAVSGCSFNYMLSEQPASKEVQHDIEVTERLTAKQKALVAKERKEVEKIRKIKCQDAKLDLLEAEAAKDRGEVNRITKRIQGLCDSNSIQ